MKEFLLSNLAGIIISAILIAAVILAIIKIIKDKKITGCNGNCTYCNSSCAHNNKKAKHPDDIKKD